VRARDRRAGEIAAGDLGRRPVRERRMREEGEGADRRPGLQREERGDARAVSDSWLTGGPGWRGGERAVRGDAG